LWRIFGNLKFKLSKLIFVLTKVKLVIGFLLNTLGLT
jgi:hypothetical protein